jgi:hypothetical protein
MSLMKKDVGSAHNLIMFLLLVAAVLAYVSGACRCASFKITCS